jgi:hypothetical protein
VGRFVTLTKNGERVSRKIRAGLDAKAETAAREWAQGIVQVMAETERGGTRYYYPGLGWTRASIPGRPPAIQSGDYARSIRAVRLLSGRWVVGSSLMVGRWSLSELLQRGTENMRPRPHFEEGYRRNRARITREMGAEIGKGIA